MKKLLALLLALTMSLSLFACGAGTGEGGGETPDGTNGDGSGSGSGSNGGETPDGGADNGSGSGSGSGNGSGELTDAEVKEYLDEKIVFLNPVYTAETLPDDMPPNESVWMVFVFEDYENREEMFNIDILNSNHQKYYSLGITEEYGSYFYTSDSHAFFMLTYRNYDRFLENDARVIAEHAPEGLRNILVYSHYTDYEHNEHKDNYHPTIKTSNALNEIEVTEDIKAELLALLNTKFKTVSLYSSDDESSAVLSVDLILSRHIGSNGSYLPVESAIDGLTQYNEYGSHFFYYTNAPIIFDGADVSEEYGDYLYVYMVGLYLGEETLKVSDVTVEDGKLKIYWDFRGSKTYGNCDIVIKIDKSKLEGTLDGVEIFTKDMHNGRLHYIYQDE